MYSIHDLYLYLKFFSYLMVYQITLESINSLCKACPTQTADFVEMLATSLALAPGKFHY